MSRRARLRPEAEGDIEEAAQWYERRAPELGHGFLDEVLATVERVESNPSQYPMVYQDVRRALIRRFPFAIFYVVGSDAGDIVVIAVMHANRDPRRWMQRR